MVLVSDQAGNGDGFEQDWCCWSFHESKWSPAVLKYAGSLKGKKISKALDYLRKLYCDGKYMLCIQLYVKFMYIYNVFM